MDDLEYRAHMDKLCLLAGLLKDEPLEELRGIVERAHAVGPIIDPTAYRAGMRNLDDQRDLLDALIGVKAVVLRVEARKEPA